MPRTEAQRRAQAKYDRKVKSYRLKFYPADEGLWAHIRVQENISEYLKRLIREDMGIEIDGEGYSIHDRGGCYFPYGRRQRVEKPEPADTWELLEMEAHTADLLAADEHAPICEADDRVLFVRRAKALAERDAYESD